MDNKQGEPGELDKKTETEVDRILSKLLGEAEK